MSGHWGQPKMVQVRCKCCGVPFIAREADRKRGWGKFCSKSCKAIKQTQRTGRGKPSAPSRSHNERPIDRSWDWDRYAESVHPFSPEAFEG